MSTLRFQQCETRARIGLKGPRGAQWLAEQGIALPPLPNTWTESGTATAGGPVAIAAALGIAAESRTPPERWIAAASVANAVPTIGTAVLIARLGASEFFLEAGGGGAAGDAAGNGPIAVGVGNDAASAGAARDDAAGGGETVRRISSALQAGLPGIYPVLREDAAFLLSGDGALDVLAQVCNVNFAALDLGPRPLIMTLMIGISVLIVPQAVNREVRYRIWCDPTFESYLGESVGAVVIDCGGSHGGVSA